MNWEGAIMTGVGAFFGVCAGILVNMCTNIWTEKRNLKQKMKSALYEIDYNILKIEEYLKYITKFKENILSDNSELFYHYFDLSKVPAPTFNELHASGVLYKYLDMKTLQGVIDVGSRRSLDYEVFFNGKVKEFLQKPDKREAIKDAGYWENSFQEDLKKMQTVRDLLGKAI